MDREAETEIMVSIIAADIGGTHARVGIVDIAPGAAPSSYAHDYTLRAYTKYRCKDFESLASVFEAFKADHALEGCVAGAIASAGYFDGDILHSVNLPWPVSLAPLRSVLGLNTLYGLNDYEAVAYSTLLPARDDAIQLNPHGKAHPGKARVVLGPGTGLGAAVLVPCGDGSATLTTEAGQMTFAPTNDRDAVIAEILRKKYEFVTVERLLSGSGLLNIYGALAEMNDQQAVLDRPSLVSDAAISGRDALADEALSTFCEILGSVAGNMALGYGARGGVYLAGGILPKFKEYLQQSRFLASYLNQGKMQSYVKAIPVTLMDHGHLGVIGAACWYANRQRCDCPVMA
ncbi:glucokinase [Kordiimonas sediminis]|uniref:Glucokinase n=1 Tax=Kordiimonas sediminis TaxID=1735581 RepID=A0A919E5D2_9PROT|nr:glucokinase [Kordiimonas sediminis]GHF13807.1 glucokinase [Kordiimonas sediminis]